MKKIVFVALLVLALPVADSFAQGSTPHFNRVPTFAAKRGYFKDSLKIEDGWFIGGNLRVCGNDAFTTSATLDTVLVTGLLSTDLVFVTTKKQAATVAGDQLGAFAGANGDTLFVSRAAGTTSGQSYFYFIVRKGY